MTLSESCSICSIMVLNGADSTLASTRARVAAAAWAEPARVTGSFGRCSRAASSRPAARSGCALRTGARGVARPPSTVVAVIAAP
jgi:hypothetical protein